MEGLEERCRALQQILDDTTTKLHEAEGKLAHVQTINSNLRDDFRAKEIELKSLRTVAKEKFSLEKQLNELNDRIVELNEEQEANKQWERTSAQMSEKVQTLE